MGCANTSEFGGFGTGNAVVMWLCLLLKQHCEKEAWKMKGKGSRVKVLPGLPGCRAGGLPGRAAQQLHRTWQGVLLQHGLGSSWKARG